MKADREFPIELEGEPISAFAWRPAEYNLKPDSFELNYGMPSPRSFSPVSLTASTIAGPGAARHGGGEQPFAVMRREKKELARAQVMTMRETSDKGAGTTSLGNVDNHHHHHHHRHYHRADEGAGDAATAAAAAANARGSELVRPRVDDADDAVVCGGDAVVDGRKKRTRRGWVPFLSCGSSSLARHRH